MRPEEIVKLILRVIWGMFPALLLVCTACLSDRVCGDEFVEIDGLCYLPKDTETSTKDAGVDGLMDPCTSNGDCKGGADYCLQPNYPDLNGYCTTQGCTLEPDNCPDGYFCLDLSAYMGGLPTVCAVPVEEKKRVITDAGGEK